MLPVKYSDFPNKSNPKPKNLSTFPLRVQIQEQALTGTITNAIVVVTRIKEIYCAIQ